jgi:sugar phosphate isomerase/epimerase
MFRNMDPKVIGIKLPIDQCIGLAKASAFEGIDINIGEVAGIARQKSLDHIKQLFDRAGLRIGGWEWFNGLERDESTYQEAIGALPEQAKIAKEIGATRVRNWILPFSDELGFKDNFRLHVKRYRIAATILRDQGLTLALEFVGTKTMRANHKYEFIWTMRQLLELIDAIGTGNVGILLDSWHWHTSGGTVDELNRLTNDQVLYVHVNDAPAGIAVDELDDNTRLLPGKTGVIKIVEFLTSLRKIGYDGPVTPEPLNREWEAIPSDVAAMRASDAMTKIWEQASFA